MEKVKLTFDEPKSKKFWFSGQEIVVAPYLTIQDQITLIKTYVETYFQPNENTLTPGDSGRDIIGADFSMMLGIVDLCTNIDVSEINLDELINSGLWDKIYKCIENYEEFQSLLRGVVLDILREKELRKSVGFVIDVLATKLSDFLDAMSNLDPESIKQLGESGVSLLKDIEKSPVTGLFKEARKSTRKKKVE